MIKRNEISLQISWALSNSYKVREKVQEKENVDDKPCSHGSPNLFFLFSLQLQFFFFSSYFLSFTKNEEVENV